MELCVARGNTDRTRMGLTVQDKRDDGPKEACASMNDGLHVAARSAGTFIRVQDPPSML